MPTTTDEELLPKDFLKRAEIRTMKKDLRALRESDALKERGKIAQIKTVEEQKAEQEKQRQAQEAIKAVAEKAGLEGVLQRNKNQEKMAEKNLKAYATEQERQQIFLLESQRFEFEKQIDIIDKEKDPALKLEKNNLLLQKRSQQEKLNPILEQEKILEGELKVITEKEQTTTLAPQRKSLEEAKWDLDKKIQDVEKKRWEVEKQIEQTDGKIVFVDKSSEQLVIEKNGLNDKILGVDKLLRDVYSAIMAREEEKRRGQTEEQRAQREILSEARAEGNEKVQRQQWTHATPPVPKRTIQIPVPVPAKKDFKKPFEAEEEQRKKFIQDVEM